MAGPTIEEVSGLQLSNNTFSASPPGAQGVADNCVISQKGVIEPRRGQDWLSTLPLTADLPFQEVEFQKQILSQYGRSKTDTAQGLGYVSGGAITPYGGGPYNPVGVDGVATDFMRLHPVLAALFLHFCTAAGPKTLETYNGTPRKSGLSRVPDPRVLLKIPTGTQLGVIPYNSSVAYRFVHKRVLSTGQVLESPVSNRTVATNRFVSPIGGLVRTGGTLVTATITPGQIYTGILMPFGIGNTFTLSPGEANFAAATYTVTATLLSPARIQWNDGGANVASTVAQELNPGPMAGRVFTPLSADAIAGDIIQLFRSAATSTSDIEPSEDLYLSNEYVLTGGDVAAGFVVIEDYTPFSACKVPLYTNPTDGDGQGELGANFPPPIYLDAANWDSRTFYLSVTGQQYLDLQMLGVGGPNGVQDGDTITVFDGVATTKTYTFRNAPSITGDVRLISDGLPSYNIGWTTFFLVQAVAPDFISHGVGIFASTSTNGFPGSFRIERTDYLQTPFQVKVSRPTSWAPAFTAATFLSSFANTVPNGLWWGKAGQPEAVPFDINATTVGVANYYGRRCFGLRNALIILKEGDGIWSLTGANGSYSLLQISTANIIAPDCAAVFSDCVWAYTDQGILRISDTGGVQTISRQIETELNRLATLYPTQTYAWSFAVADETERRILFYVPVGVSPSNPNLPVLEAFCYSAATNAWTKFNHRAISAVVTTDRKLVTGLYDEVFSTGRLTKERRTGTIDDIADAQWPNTLATTADPLVVRLTTDGAIQQGTGISQTIGGTVYRTKVTQVLGAGQYRLAEIVPWANGACTIYDPYPVEWRFLPAGTPGSRKVLTRLAHLFKPQSFSNLFGLTVLLTDQIQEELQVSTPLPGYGLTPYGVGPYGNPSPMVVDVNPIDAKWVSAGQFFPGFRLNEVWCQAKAQGLGLELTGAAAPVGRGT